LKLDDVSSPAAGQPAAGEGFKYYDKLAVVIFKYE
jgi:hypothetical protein